MGVQITTKFSIFVDFKSNFSISIFYLSKNFGLELEKVFMKFLNFFIFGNFSKSKDIFKFRKNHNQYQN